MRKADAVQIACLLGMSAVFMAFGMFFLATPMSSSKKDQDATNEILKAPITAFRTVFVFIYILFGAGLVI